MLPGFAQFFEQEQSAPTPPLPYDAEVEWLGVDSAGPYIVVSGLDWDSFACSLYVPSSTGYPDYIGGDYVYLGCNSIRAQNGNYRTGASFMGFTETVAVITGRFVEYTSPSPTNLKWTIDGTDYAVTACRNPGGDFGMFTLPAVSGRAPMRLAWVKTFKGGNVTGDFIPVRVGTVGYMYDRVSGALFRNAGTGNFIVGRDTNPISARSYVNDGLVAMWDGIENAGWGVHDQNATTWMNLVTGVASENIGVRTWGDSWLETTGSIDLNLSDNEPNSRTMEVVFQTTSSDVQNVIMSMYTRRVIGTAGTSIGIGPYSAIPVDAVSGEKWSVSAVYPNEGSTPDAAYINGLANTDRTSGNFTNPVSSSIRIGGLYSKPFSGKVYCIRLYSRQLAADEIAANYAIDRARFNLP